MARRLALCYIFIHLLYIVIVIVYHAHSFVGWFIIGTITLAVCGVYLEYIYFGGDKNVTHRAPGWGLNRFAEFFCSKKTMERVVTPNLSDMYLEYCEALNQRRTKKAIWIRIRGTYKFWVALGLHTLLETVIRLWRRLN